VAGQAPSTSSGQALGAVRELRWLFWLWLTGLVMMLLLGPANALLLKLAHVAAVSGLGEISSLFGGVKFLTAAAAQPIHLFVDEGWHLLQYAGTAAELGAMARRFRKHYAAIHLASQFGQHLCTLKGSEAPCQGAGRNGRDSKSGQAADYHQLLAGGS